MNFTVQINEHTHSQSKCLKLSPKVKLICCYVVVQYNTGQGGMLDVILPTSPVEIGRNGVPKLTCACAGECATLYYYLALNQMFMRD